MTTTITADDGSKIILKPDKTYEIVRPKNTNNTTNNTPRKKRTIDYKDIPKVLAKMSDKKILEVFGKLNKDNAYEISCYDFWKLYKLKQKNYTPYINMELKREFIIPVQMKHEKLKPSEIRSIWNKTRQILYKKMDEHSERKKHYNTELLNNSSIIAPPKK
jgi:hypothetical protein